LLYPSKNALTSADFTMKFTDNEYTGEGQIVEALRDAQKYTDDVSSDTFLKKVEARLFTQKQMPWADIKKRAATNTLWQWHRPDALDQLKEDCLHKDIWRESGGYVEKGPFPKPDASVTVQELARDDETGEVTLRIIPLHADVVYTEVGASATVASERVTDYKAYKTSDLEVSFLSVDSTHEHKTGAPIVYKNRITIKSKAYWQGKDMMVELRAAPPAPIRYTTDGSNPKNSGGAYNGAFVVPKGTQVVLAYAEHRGIASEVHRLDIQWDQSKAFEVDPIKPATWAKEQKRENTQAAYGLLSDLRKHRGRLSSVRMMVSQDNAKWVEVNFGDQVMMEPDALENIVNTLRSVLDTSAVSIWADKLHFQTGQGLIDFASEAKMGLEADEVIQ
jgi:hypothetical protein